MAGLDEKECKQRARRSRGGQNNYQKHRQESDDLNIKDSLQVSYFRRQNNGNEVMREGFVSGGTVNNFTKDHR
jgi:hypothetical protein